MKRYVYISLAATVLASCAVFKDGKKAKAKKAAATAAAAAKPVPPVSKNGIKPYATVISKNLIVKPGLFTVIHSPEMDSIFFEVGDSLLGRDIMVINRLIGAPGGMNVHAGEELDNNTIIFEKGPNETIRIRYNIVAADANTTDNIYRAVQNSNVNPIVVSFPIKAYGKDSASYVIDASKFLKDPASLIHSLEKGQISGLDPRTLKEHEVNSLRAYPMNVEIATTKNGNFKTIFSKNPAPVTIESNTSFILLPEKPMQRRFADERVGYFTDWVHEFGDHQQKTKTREFLNRWRLEPKPEDMEKYKRGELVEPVKPIVLYIDPATPKQWRKFLILGVNDWQVAFEKAGFKNAIMAKEWPENDSTMHMEDARYSFINYFASPVANAYGPNIHDSRSGEIIQTHIGWYHNVMNLLRNWYMIQGGPNDSGARNAVFDEELMGQLIRFVSSHEVGHTLGLRHNFGSSSMTPTDSLRSKTYLAKHGHTASIMDYARFNYVAQPEDNIPRELLFPRIAEYDQWAIEWGYKYTGAATAAEDQKIMAKLATERLAANPRLWFGDGESRKTDPRCQTEDLGDDIAKSNTLGIKNLRRVMAGLPQWTMEDNGLNGELKEMYNEVKSQYFRYVNHVIRFVGTTQYTVRSNGDTRPAFEAVPREKQLAALKFFEDELFVTPTWIMDAKVAGLTEESAAKDFVSDLQEKVVNSLLDGQRLNFMLVNEQRFGKQALGFDEYIGRVRNAIWQPIMKGTVKTDLYQRNMQRNYLGAIMAVAGSVDPVASESEAAARLSAEIRVLKNIIEGALSRTTDSATKMHLQTLAQKIKQLEAKKA
ncbi:zinc-dependent metalloprotease [Chitinophaga deserti]|uniref:zinc-dependent metalloprotease n=1 Tax=Chitinophaga deserti TaxID=2164099 RepID=UPI000D6D2CD9|nr:zinc-dependent metalloprotease [Chitinophaga deserti]